MKPSHFDLLAFFSGASVMILEIIGSRVIAPFIGASLYVWTSLIGVILLAMSVGYFIGGILADRHREKNTLAAIFLSASIFVVAIPLLAIPSLKLGMGMDPKLGAVFSSFILFFIPAGLMGMVSPYLIRLTTKEIGEVGQSAGRIFAVSTVGSIAGTFASGFLLIPLLGINAILYLVGIILFVMALSLIESSRKIACAVFFAFIASSALSTFSGVSQAFGTDGSIYSVDTPYYRISVRDTPDARILFMDREPQAAISTNSSGWLYYLHTKYIALIPYMLPNATDYLTVGGGACTEQTYLLRNTDYSVDTVELDPATFPICRDYFGYPGGPRTKEIISDGRAYLEQDGKRYDVIRTDVFLSGCQVPFHLSTIEYARAVKDRLKPGGIAWLTVPGSLDGRGSAFVRSQFSVYKDTFRHIYVFLETQDRYHPQSIGIFATDSEIDIDSLLNKPGLDGFSGYYYMPSESEFGKPLTDDYAPVEAMLDNLCV